MKIQELTRLQFFYGEEIKEAFLLDFILSALADGTPRTVLQLTTPVGSISTWELHRKTDHLIQNNMIKITGEVATITSNGAMHLGKGGYTGEIKRIKHLSISFWLSIAAFILSVVSIVRTFVVG